MHEYKDDVLIKLSKRHGVEEAKQIFCDDPGNIIIFSDWLDNSETLMDEVAELISNDSYCIDMESLLDGILKNIETKFFQSYEARPMPTEVESRLRTIIDKTFGITDAAQQTPESLLSTEPHRSNVVFLNGRISANPPKGPSS